MKWAIAGLCFLGILAASSAAFLVMSLRYNASGSRVQTPSTQPSAMIQVLVAGKALQPMTVIDSSDVTVKNVNRDAAPVGYITDPTDVVGKVVEVQLAEGTAFTAATFSSNSQDRQIAAVIPKGMRAVGITITDYAGLDGILSPGSIVDVFASFKVDWLDTNDPHPKTVAVNLLDNVQVLAIESQSVVSSPSALGVAADESSRINGSHRVTLLVDDQQAKSLQIVMEKGGSLALGLRNPLDTTKGDDSAIWESDLVPDLDSPKPTAPPAVAQAPSLFNPATAATATSAADPAHWDTIVIRGGAVETKSFPMPNDPK